MKVNNIPEPLQMARLLRRGDVEVFASAQLSESYLLELARMARSEGYFDVIVADLINKLTVRPSREFDWNVGSLLQHSEPEWVFKNLPQTSPNREALYESIGLTWCLGEFGHRDPAAIAFLEDTVARARSSASWFRAALSLEKIGLVDSISYLKASLRSQGTPTVDSCLADLGDYRNRVGILLHSTVDNLHYKILPRLKQVLCDNNSDSFQRLGAAWLIGRFKYLDPEIQLALMSLVNATRYEVRFYALQTLGDIGSPRFIPLLVDFLNNKDPLLRKIAAQGLSAYDTPEVTLALQEALYSEMNPEVIGAMTQAIYDISHHAHRRERDLRQRIGANENGMIADAGDKWYVNPDIYHVFSQSQDPSDLSFRVALRDLAKLSPLNPVDIGSGTGRFVWYLREHLPFEGQLICVDHSKEMIRFLQARFRRESVPDSLVRIVESKTEEIADHLGGEISDLVVANFAFPSRISDAELVLRELKAICHVLRPGGHLVTVGWDETFNDELSEMWYRYVPDGIRARNFEEWRNVRVSSIKSARNGDLTWHKRGLRVPVEFVSVEMSARVMGYLFGRSAAEEIVRTQKTRWSMSVGITVDTREHIAEILTRRGLSNPNQTRGKAPRKKRVGSLDSRI